MKKLLFSVIVLVSSIGSWAQENNIDVLHYQFNIGLSDKNDSIHGVAFIRFIVKENTSSVSFDLYNRTKNKGMTVNMVTNAAGSGGSNMKFRQENEKIIIDHNYSKGDTGYIEIDYSGVPDDGLIISRNKYGDKTFFADNWPNRAHHWIPCIDRPDDKASFEFSVKAPPAYSVVSNGIKTQEEVFGDSTKLTHWEEHIALPTKVMVIGVAKFAVKTYSDSPDNIPVSAWVYKQDSLPGFRNYSVAPSILKFLIDYIGPYPYEKLANVQSKTIFGGMENASAIFYEETSAALFQNVETLLAHEIAHQWFGDMASEKSFPHLWLSEGFATYLTHIYIESKYGTDSLATEMKNDRAAIASFVKESNRPVVDSVSQLMELLNANSYQKGGWVLHMLRIQLGDTVFHNIIRKYYAIYAGKNADTRDFEKICETESGKNLRYFFDQWLYTPGIPKLDVQWRYDDKKKVVLVNVQQLQNKPFQFPLDFRIDLSTSESQLKTLTITRSSQEFSIPAGRRPLGLTLDPRTSLLFTGTVQASK